ncbi:MAG: hypothetical protein WCV81_03110 [Microgenomates group bacterium]|jgi:hypothetical protein
MLEATAKHEFGDECPATLDLGTFKGIATLGLIYGLARYPLNSILYKVGLGKAFLPFEAISALKQVREYIKTTPEQTALSEFQAPGVFDSNKYSPGTIVRLAPSLRARASLFENDETKIPLYDHKTKIVKEIPRGWVELSMPTEKILLSYPRSFLGVVRKLRGYSDHIIVYFENDQQKIMSKFVSPKFETKALALGKEAHVGLVGQYFNRVGFRIDLIASMEKAEILAMGTPVKEKSKVPAERNPAMAKGFSYFPT